MLGCGDVEVVCDDGSHGLGGREGMTDRLSVWEEVSYLERGKEGDGNEQKEGSWELA